MKNKEVIVLELCSKGDLFNVVLENSEILNEDSILKNLFTQICSGIQAIHDETKNAHLDIKLDNILIGDDYKLKICDMGLAQPINEKLYKKYGTTDYMAPEVFLAEASDSTGYHPIKADMFALGVSLFIMKFGLPPWKAPTLNTDRLYTRFVQDKELFQRTHPSLRKAKE